MSPNLLSHRVLDALRALGDPYPFAEPVDRAYAIIGDQIGHQAFGTYLPGLFTDAFLDPDDQDRFDSAKLERACGLFGLYGSEIGAGLLLAALPEAYAASTGSRILYELSALANRSPGFLTRRIEGTAQFLVNVMVAPSCTIVPDPVGMASPALQIARGLWGLEQPPGGRAGVDGRHMGRALAATLGLRLRHEALRRVAETAPAGIIPAGEVFLNQEDLLGTLLTFSVTVFEVLEQLGISWSADDQEAYLYAWDLVGHYLGIGDTAVLAALPSDVAGDPSLEMATRRGTLRPGTVAEARALLDRIRQRVWTPNGNPAVHANQTFTARLDDVTPGRVLLRALVEDISAAMPPTKREWPLRIIRQLVPPTVRDRLALGGTPTWDLVLGALPGGRATTGPFTFTAKPNRLRAGYLRYQSTEVVDRYFGKLVNEKLTIPGLAWGGPGDALVREESAGHRRRARAAPPL